MGDGYSRYGNGGLSVEILLSTNSFVENDVRFLAKQLVDDYGISFHVWHRYSKYWVLRTNKNIDTHRFMCLIQPYVIPCFDYKIKHLEKYKNQTDVDI
jgi:hypothetical protein